MAQAQNGELTRRKITGLIAGLTGLLALPRAARSGPSEKASLRLDWALSGYQLPFYWAKAKGYYGDAGIDLDIKDGAGSAKSVNLAAAKEDTFALADSLITANSIAKGVKVKSILVVVQNGGSAIVSWADKPVRTPLEMAGKSVGAAADQKTTIDLLLSINKVPKDAVTVRLVSVAARNTIFYQKQVDAIVSTLIGSPMDMVVAAREGKGAPVHLMPFSDFGITAMSAGVCVHEDTLAEKPDLVRRFTVASLRAMQDISDEARADEATDIAMRLSRAPAQRRESVKLQWLATLPRLQTEHSKGKPLGWTSEADWQNLVDLLVKTDSVSKPVPPGTLYTNEFIPV